MSAIPPIHIGTDRCYRWTSVKLSITRIEGQLKPDFDVGAACEAAPHAVFPGGASYGRRASDNTASASPSKDSAEERSVGRLYATWDRGVGFNPCGSKPHTVTAVLNP